MNKMISWRLPFATGLVLIACSAALSQTHPFYIGAYDPWSVSESPGVVLEFGGNLGNNYGLDSAHAATIVDTPGFYHVDGFGLASSEGRCGEPFFAMDYYAEQAFQWGSPLDVQGRLLQNDTVMLPCDSVDPGWRDDEIDCHVSKWRINYHNWASKSVISDGIAWSARLAQSLPGTFTNLAMHFELVWHPWGLDSSVTDTSFIASMALYIRKSDGSYARLDSIRWAKRNFSNLDSFPVLFDTLTFCDTLADSTWRYVTDQSYSDGSSWIEAKIYCAGNANVTIRKFRVMDDKGYKLLRGDYDSTIEAEFNWFYDHQDSLKT
jgi:hypothetical protein